MKKKIINILLVLICLVPVVVFAEDAPIGGSDYFTSDAGYQKCTGETCYVKTAYGTYVRLWEYDYRTKRAQAVGQAYLIPTANLLRKQPDGARLFDDYETDCGRITSGSTTITVRCHDRIFYDYSIKIGNSITQGSPYGYGTLGDLSNSMPKPSKNPDYLIWIQGTQFGDPDMDNAVLLSSLGANSTEVGELFGVEINPTTASRYYVSVEPVVRERYKIHLGNYGQESRNGYNLVQGVDRFAISLFYQCPKNTSTTQYTPKDSLTKTTTSLNSVPAPQCRIRQKKTVEVPCDDDDGETGGVCRHPNGTWSRNTTKEQCEKNPNYWWEEDEEKTCTEEQWVDTGRTTNAILQSATATRGYQKGTTTVTTVKTANLKHEKICGGIIQTINANPRFDGNYIGPNSTRSMVGGSGPWKLLTGNDKNTIVTNCDTRQATSGIGFYWVQSLFDCPSQCKKYVGNDEDYLRCAEQYCDETLSVRKAVVTGADAEKVASEKRNCLIQNCLIEEPSTKHSVSCEGLDKNGKRYDPFANVATGALGTTTTCNVDDRTGTPGDNSGDYYNVGSHKYCTNSKTNICSNGANCTTGEDSKIYYSISCYEETGVQFRDTSKDYLLAGTGLEYYAKVQGVKWCKIYFDWSSWEFDYAAVHSEDADAKFKRGLLKDQVKWFNNLVEGKENVDYEVYGKPWTINAKFGMPETVVIQPPSTKLEDLTYDSNIVLTSNFNEILDVNGTGERSKNYILIDENKNHVASPLTIYGSRTLYLFDHLARANNNGKDITMMVYNYDQKSSISSLYIMPYQCLTSDGKAVSVDSNSKKCPDGTVAKNVFYTNLKALATKILHEANPGINHEANTTITVEAGKDGTEYVNVRESCPYNIIDSDGREPSPDESLESGLCEVSIIDGTRIPNSDKYNGSVELQLSISDKIGINEIDYFTFDATANSTDTKSAEIEENYYFTVNPVACKNNEKTVRAVVTLKDGTKFSCSKKVEPVTDCPSVQCAVRSTGLHVYNVEATVGKSNVNENSGYRGWVNDERNSLVLTPTTTKEHKLFVTDGEEIGSYTVFGRVTDRYGNTDICWLHYDDPDLTCTDGHCRCTENCTPDDKEKIERWCSANWQSDEDGYTSEEDCVNSCGTNNCRTAYTQDDIGGIKAYCERNWDKDVAGYTSYTACLNGCSNGRIRTSCSRIIGVRGYSQNDIVSTCNERWEEYGFSNAQNCATLCCTTLGTCSGNGDYIYRPINPPVPFPNSYLTNAVEDIRPVGGNWIGKEDYIIKQTDLDKDDETNVESRSAEYIIDLSPAQVSAIRRNNAEYNDAHENGNVFADYVYASDDYLTQPVPYVSEFIHGSEFSSYFSCTYDPETRKYSGDCGF